MSDNTDANQVSVTNVVQDETPKQPTKKQFTEDELANVLTMKQKRNLGIASTRPKTEKEIQRIEALRERMREINNRRREEKTKIIEKPQKPVKRKPPPPSESSEESSSDEYIQRKAKKVNKTLAQMSKVDQYIHQLKAQNSHNPYFNLMMR